MQCKSFNFIKSKTLSKVLDLKYNFLHTFEHSLYIIATYGLKEKRQLMYPLPYSSSFTQYTSAFAPLNNMGKNYHTTTTRQGHLKIYTKTGDKGLSSLFNGERRPKSDPVFDALGNIDELSSAVGLAKEYALLQKHSYVDQLERVQCILQDIGSLIATPTPNIEGDPERERRIQEKLSFDDCYIKDLENWIDHFTEKTPPLSNFILPGGGSISAHLHMARSICRRAERSIVPLSANAHVDEKVLIYINRLSDYFFSIARFATVLEKQKETIYIRPK